MNDLPFYIIPVATIALGFVAGWQIFRNPPSGVNEIWTGEPINIRNWRMTVFAILAGSLAVVSQLSYRIDKSNRELQETAGVLSSSKTVRVLTDYLNTLDTTYTESPFLGKVFAAQFTKFSQVVDDAKSGIYRVPIKDLADAAISLIESANREIRATSYVTDNEWWNTAWGKAYLDENRKAVLRGVTIERVFILKDEDDLKKKQALLRANVEAGVKVKYAFAEKLQEPFTQDVVLVDGHITGVLSLVGQSAKGVVFSANKDAIDRVSKVLRVAFIQARKFEPGAIGGVAK